MFVSRGSSVVTYYSTSFYSFLTPLIRQLYSTQLLRGLCKFVVCLRTTKNIGEGCKVLMDLCTNSFVKFSSFKLVTSELGTKPIKADC